MALLSLSSQRLDQFFFRGFLPAETEARRKAWNEVRKENRAFILMDTPYRLGKLLSEAKDHLNDRKILLTLDLTQNSELILEGTPSELLQKVEGRKAEFMMLVYPRK
jgi:16S rRNA (cytidine1402-2'-O)-methyltransferase